MTDRSCPRFRRAADGGEFVERRLPNMSLFLMVVLLIAFVLFPYMVVTVPSGQIGVLWKRFAGGTVLDPRLLKDEGLHIILPWDKVYPL